MSGRSYPQLYQQLQDLIARGTKVADATAGTPAAEIHDWIKEAQYCLALLEDKIPSALSDFKRLRENFEFKVDEDGDIPASASAYNPRQTDPSTGQNYDVDVLLDFRFENLAEATAILTFAARKIEMDGQSLPALGQELREARRRAGHGQREAAKALGYDHRDISDWETGKREPLAKQVPNIRDYILKYSEEK